MLIAAAAFGLVVGGVLGLVGAGGAIVAVPALVYGLGLPLASAIPTSLIMAATSSAVAVIPRLHGGIRWRTAVLVGGAGIPAAFVGTYVNSLLDSRIVLGVFALLMIAAGLQMLRRRPELIEGGEVGSSARRVMRTLLIGLGVGFLTGLLGVGGGFVIVPALVLLLDIPMGAAVGTSLVITTVNSIAGLVAHASTSHVNWPITLAFAGSALVASLLAGRFARRLTNRALQIGFAGLVFVVASYTIVRVITAV